MYVNLQDIFKLTNAMGVSVKYKTVNEYFAAFPDDVKAILECVRKTIKEAAPNAVELISYNMPAFKINGILVYYAANKAHIGFYPTASPIQVFKGELQPYKWSKGAIQFPINEPMPIDLISRIVKYRVHEDLEKVKGDKLTKFWKTS